MTGNRLYPTSPILAASVAVFRAGHVLLAVRGKPPAEGLFSLPGGRVELGETLGEAALRELHEEVGVKAKLIGSLAPVEVIERDADGRVKLHIVVVAHAARWVSGEPRTGPEAREIRWVTERDIAGLPMTAGLAGILEQAFRLERIGAVR
jgi:ADP-ribose pyrophosphatase YjhB (NUDIX family)